MTRRTSAQEVVADLRAMHGCLTTGVLLLDPALDDLRGLAAPAITSTTTEGDRMRHEAAEGDWADQQVPVELDGAGDVDDTAPECTIGVTSDAAVSLEVDPVDAAEQQRTAPHDEDRGP